MLPSPESWEWNSNRVIRINSPRIHSTLARLPIRRGVSLNADAQASQVGFKLPDLTEEEQELERRLQFIEELQPGVATSFSSSNREPGPVSTVLC